MSCNCKEPIYLTYYVMKQNLWGRLSKDLMLAYGKYKKTDISAPFLRKNSKALHSPEEVYVGQLDTISSREDTA